MTTTWQIFRVLPIIHLSGQQKKTLKSFFSVSHTSELRFFTFVGQYRVRITLLFQDQQKWFRNMSYLAKLHIIC